MALQEKGLELHAACRRGEREVVEELLDSGAEVDAQKIDGETALMSACKEGHAEIAELLLDRDAKVNLESTKDVVTALILACEKGHTEIAELLLNRGAQVDLQRPKDGLTALKSACRNGHTEAAKLLLDRGAKVDLQMKNGWSALISACRNGHTEAAKLLLDRGAKVDLQSTDGWAALMMACEKGCTKTVKLLVDRGAKVDMQSKSIGWTALMMACKRGHTKTVKLLLARDAKVDLQSTKDVVTALILACENGHTEAAKLLLDRGAKVDLQMKNGWSALISACRNGHTEAAKLLLDRGAKVDLQSTDGWTALMMACEKGCTKTVKLLVDRGAKVDMQSKSNGWTALMMACKRGHTKTVKLLLARDAKVDLQSTKDVVTALILACENGHTEIAELLLDRDPKVDLQMKNGWSALISACRNGHTEAAKLLLDRGAKVDLQSTDGWTALMMACEKGCTKTVKLLVDRSAKIDMQSKSDGWTALMLSCREGHTEAAKLLVDRGAKVDMQSKSDGWTALMMACVKGCTETAELLVDRGAEVNLQSTNDGCTALMSACRKGHTEAAKLLLDRGAEVDLQRTGDGSSALMLACRGGHTKAAKLLLDRGAKVELGRHIGRKSSLMFACLRGRSEVAKLLLDCGAEVDLQCSGGRTSLMLTCREGHADVAALLLDWGAQIDVQGEGGITALIWAALPRHSDIEQAEVDQRSVAIIKLLCMRSNGMSFASLGGPTALRCAKENNLPASIELLEFLSDSSPLAPFNLPCKTLAFFYARNVRTPEAAADLSGPELYFMGLKDTKERHEAMDRFRAVLKAQLPGDDTLDALALKVEHARDAHKRGQDAISCNLTDLKSLLSLQPYGLAASSDFDAAMNTIREAKKRLEDLQARAAHDVSLVAETDEVRAKLASLMTASIPGIFRYAIERLEKNNDPSAAENICSRIWACLSDDPLGALGDPVPSEEDIDRACQVAKAAIATWKQREKVILARMEVDAALDKLEAAAPARSPVQTCFLSLRYPAQVQQLASELGAVKDAFEKELRALCNDDPMDEAPLAEIRSALQLIARPHAEACKVELARCRAASHDLQMEVVEGLIDRIHEVRSHRDELEVKLRHARGKRPRTGALADTEKLAKLEDELKNLPCVYKLDRELCQERARIIRYAERHSPELLKDSTWCQQVGLANEALTGVGKLELWLANVARADFAQVKALATRPGKEVYKVRDPNGRELVLKAFHLADDSLHSRFCRQVQALAELKSAYLVHIEGVFVDASFGCILMPYYAGGDLAAWIRDNPHASDETRKRIAGGVLSGVHDLHQRRLVHCDINPGNIFLTQALTPVLGDFDALQISDVTVTKRLQIRSHYAAPELRGDGVSKVAPTVDLFSVGVVLSKIFPTPSAALQSLIDKLQAEDPTQRPSALKALEHEAFYTSPTRSWACLICLENYPEAEGVCCESDHFACKSCLAATIRAASQPDAHVQLKRNCSMPCVANVCKSELSGKDLAKAAPDEFETLLKIARRHFERETAADTEKELRRRVSEALLEDPADRTLRVHIEHIQNKILTLSCPQCETTFADFDGCCALQCSNSSCACFFCAWCLQGPSDSEACHVHIAGCPKKPPGEADAFFSQREVVQRAWCKLRATRLRAYVRNSVRGRKLQAKVRKTLGPLLTEDVVGPMFRF